MPILSREKNVHRGWKRITAHDEDVGEFTAHISLRRRRRFYWLADVVNKKQYRRGVEIGVHKATTTYHLLVNCPRLEMLVGIDPWCAQPRNKGPNVFAARRWKHDRNENMARKRAGKFPGRCRLVKGYSHEVAGQFVDGEFDFVFVDGDHSYRACKQDIQLWLPKVRPGGLLCGHDINWLSVWRAVEELLPGFEHDEDTQDYLWWYWV